MLNDTYLKVKYRCQHPSCVVNCREGVLDLDEEHFKDLYSAYEAEGIFKSPKGVCRMGFPQQFKVLDQKTVSLSDEEKQQAEEFNSGVDSNNPISILMAEHQAVLQTLDQIEREMRTRDVKALWQTTAKLVNEVTLHSIKKEEEILFPLLGSRLPFADGLIAIVKEDHAEFLGLLYSFREGLEIGDILDGIGNSTIVNLRNHIRKEDAEFFTLIDSAVTDDLKAQILADFKKAEERFVPMVPGELSIDKAKESEKAKKRRKFDEEAAAVRAEVLASADGGGCCGH